MSSGLVDRCVSVVGQSKVVRAGVGLIGMVVVGGGIVYLGEEW